MIPKSQTENEIAELRKSNEILRENLKELFERLKVAERKLEQINAILRSK